MITSAISERRKVDGGSYARVGTNRKQSRCELSSPAEFIGDVVNQIAPERGLPAAVLRQATLGLQRFRQSKEADRREMYWDARRWFISSDAEWPYSFMKACCSLGRSPEGGARRSIRGRALWLGCPFRTCRLRQSNAAGGLALASLLVSPQRCSRAPRVMKTQPRSKILMEPWRRLMRRRALAHDPFLSLSITLFNFSSGWDRLLQKQGQLSTPTRVKRR
jgi:hypothetical protein